MIYFTQAKLPSRLASSSSYLPEQSLGTDRCSVMQTAISIQVGYVAFSAAVVLLWIGLLTSEWRLKPKQEL